MKTIDLFKILQEINSVDDFFAVSEKLGKEGYRVAYDTSMKRYFVSRNLRSEIKEALKREDLSIRQVGQFLEYDSNNLTKYLNGNRGIPEKYLERLLALLNL